LLHLGQGAGLLQGAQGDDDGVEQVHKDQGAVLVEVRGALVGAIALAADTVEAVEERQQLLDIAEALELSFGDRRAPGVGQAKNMTQQPRGRKLDLFTLERSVKGKISAEQDWVGSLFRNKKGTKRVPDNK
jgi:hypothetical protein